MEEMEKEDYFSDDCIVENNYYKTLKDLLTCPLCSKIFKEPLMCSNCQKVYCQKCLELKYIKGKICPNNCKNITFIKSIVKNEMLSKILYKCKNCSKEVMQNDIKSHLESNCSPQSERTKTLSEIYQTKKEIIRLSPQEMSKIDKNSINHFTSKY